MDRQTERQTLEEDLKCFIRVGHCTPPNSTYGQLKVGIEGGGLEF